MSKWWKFYIETQNSFSDISVFVNTVFWESAIFIVAMETIFYLFIYLFFVNLHF